MNDIAPGSIFQQYNPYETTIRQLLQVDSQKKQSFQSQKSALSDKKAAISDIGSKLTDLNSLLSTFKDPLGRQLNPLMGQSSNEDAISVLSTDGLKNTGSYNISVGQLAKNDVALSGTFTSDAHTLNSSGNASFTLDVGSSTSATVSVDTTGLSDKEVLSAIAAKVNDEFEGSLQATVFDLGTGESQLSLKSLEKGKSSRITISNVQGDAAALNLNNVYGADDLNAKFTIDSVSFERSTNKVDDAVPGLSFELKQASPQMRHIDITNDTDRARESIKSFIDKFNSVNSLIRKKTYLDGESGARGPLEDKRSVRNLSLRLRQDASFPVSGLSGKPVQSLFDLGIDLRKDGEMYIRDSDKLDSALKNTPNEVKTLFAADGGLVDRLKNSIDAAITNDGNIFDNIKDGIDRKINRLDDRIDRQDDFLARQEQKYRKRYADLQQAITEGQYQFQQIINLRSRLGY